MRTKIVATIGPASNSRETIAQMAEAGVSIFRLNFSHGNFEFFKEVVAHIRDVEKECGRPLTIMQDLPGPKIRVGILPEGKITLNRGDMAVLGRERREKEELPFIPFDHPRILAALNPGDMLVLADGGLEFRVEEKLENERFSLIALEAGTIYSRKGLALPGKALALPAITEQDREKLALGMELGVDAVAISFVQTVNDVLQLKALIHAYGRDDIPVVAKLERQNAAVDNLEEIVKATDIVMVARGDLGVECPMPELPALQKHIIHTCNRAGKPVIVATQMLLSMVNSLLPTRAEVTDVANAVLDGADCVMLSEETAAGNHPVEAVNYMRKITDEAEKYLLSRHNFIRPEDADTSRFLAYTACLLAQSTNACAIVAHSVTGGAARMLAENRPQQTIYALTPNTVVEHALNFVWGVQPFFLPSGDSSISHLRRVQSFIAASSRFPAGEDIVITAGEYASGEQIRRTNLVKIYHK
ncbi:pyruvate kinase [uncultured Mailhella sp.]|uniref:pyruvate kinase n=1 Tax=uncultured Mailhella sp. TaxID=1981031 RepID=UPI00260BFC73|nr:pyruvate kinase [uncultured Mailhella sp.]